MSETAHIRVFDLVEQGQCQLICGDPDAVIKQFCIDSRQAQEGVAFVAFEGEKVDGNDFAPSALESGAAAVVLTKEPDSDLLEIADKTGSAVLLLKDQDPEAFLLALASWWREVHPEWLVVAVTGSVGKTTTKDMCAAVFGSAASCYKTQGNFNNLIGLPLTILNTPADAEFLILEMGMNHKGEIEQLSLCARPHLGIITNIGTAHIGLLGSREAIADAKAEILLGMSSHPRLEKPLLFIPHSDDFAHYIQDKASSSLADCVLVGAPAEDSYYIEDLELNDEGMPRFSLCYRPKKSSANFSSASQQAEDALICAVELKSYGRHVAADALLAWAAGLAAGIEPVAAAVALEKVEPSSMRCQIVKNPGRPCVIDDSYNASTVSIAAALDLLSSHECRGRRIAVLGEMGELGEASSRLHALVGAYAAAKPLDMLVVVGDQDAKYIVEGAHEMGLSDDVIVRAATAQEALDIMKTVVKEDDLILVKASRSAGLDLFAKGVSAVC